MKTERELKLLLPEESAKLFLSKFEPFKGIDQENFYFDTISHHLSAVGTTLRIRSEQGTYILCAKIKNRESVGIAVSEEWEERLNVYEFQSICQSPNEILTYLPDEIHRVLSTIVMGAPILLLGSIRNFRNCLRVNDWIIELDRSVFPNEEVQYEIEVEGVTSEEESIKIQNFLANLDLSCQPSVESKYKRFLKALKAAMDVKSINH